MMKRLSMYFTLLLLVMALLPQVGLGQDKSITIATFNCEFLTRPKVHIKFGLPFDINQAPEGDRQQWNQPVFRNQKFNEAAKEVANVLNMINADVLALTEVGDEADVTELRNETAAWGLSYPHLAVGHSTDTTTRQHVAVLSKFPLTEILLQIPGREYYIPEPDDPETEEHTGISKGMRVTFTAHNREFLLYVLHLASERGGHEQDQQRIAQASIVRRHYLPALNEGKLIIIAGDLNDYRGQPTLLRIRGLDDIYEDLIQTGHKDFFDDDKLGTRWTYEFEGIRQQIDHILLSFSVKEACKSRGGIKARTIDHGSAPASDHRPFVVTLTLNNN